MGYTTYKQIDGEHKYSIGQRLWIQSHGIGESAFIGEVLRTSNKYVCDNASTGLPIIINTYFIKASGYDIFGSFDKRGNEDYFVEIGESLVLADYDNEEQMEKYRG